MPEPFDSLPLTDAMLAGMVSISSDAIIAVDAAQTIVFFNAGAEQTFGYSASEAVGRPLGDLMPARYRDAHRGHIARFGHAHELARRMGERQQISGLRSNGEEFPAEASIARIAVEERELYTVVLRDVTARQRIEQDLRLAIESRDQMSGVVSHDLRNPVSAVRMLSGAILRRTGADAVPPDVAEQVEVIHRAAEQMDALITDLADVTRIESGRLHVRPVPTDPADLIVVACDTLLPQAEAKSQRLNVQLAEPLPRVLADPDRVIQLLSNLLGNAIRFTPAGGVIDVIAPTAPPRPRAASEGDVVFLVRDNGPGISAENLPHIFNRYWQSPGAVRAGSGLGLTIARGIVEALGGWIAVESNPGAGTSVWFALPRAAGNAPT